MKKHLWTVRLLIVLALVSALFITGCKSTSPSGNGDDNGNGDPQLPGYTGMEVLEMAGNLGKTWDEDYPETVTVGGDEISLADSLYLMAQWLVLFDGTNEETGEPGTVPELVPYKEISIPNAVTEGKTDGVVVWDNVNQLAKDIVDALDVDPQIPDEITVLWHPLADWVDLQEMEATEETLGINIVISILARTINWTQNHSWMFANFSSVRGGDLPASWPTPAEEPATYTLTLAAEPAEGGEVTDNTNAGPYEAGTTVSVTATANEGYDFVNWTVDSDEASDQATFEYTMPAENVTLTANFEEVQVSYTGEEVVAMAANLGLGWDEDYPETVSVGDDEISLADSVYLMAQVLVALEESGATNVETGVSGTPPEFVDYKEISIPDAVTQGKTEGVVTWENIFVSAQEMVDALDADPQIPDEITVLWHPSGVDWKDIKEMEPEEETLGINILISCYARMINYASNNDWQFANWATIRGGDLPASWPQ